MARTSQAFPQFGPHNYIMLSGARALKSGGRLLLRCGSKCPPELRQFSWPEAAGSTACPASSPFRLSQASASNNITKCPKRPAERPGQRTSRPALICRQSLPVYFASRPSPHCQLAHELPQRKTCPLGYSTSSCLPLCNNAQQRAAVRLRLVWRICLFFHYNPNRNALKFKHSRLAALQLPSRPRPSLVSAAVVQREIFGRLTAEEQGLVCKKYCQKGGGWAERVTATRLPPREAAFESGFLCLVQLAAKNEGQRGEAGILKVGEAGNINQGRAFLRRASSMVLRIFSVSCSKMRSMRSQQVKQTISKTPSSLGYFSSPMASWWYLPARCPSTRRSTSVLATAKSVTGWLSSRLKMGLPREPKGRSSSKMSLNSSQMQWLKEKQPGRKYWFLSTSRSNSSMRSSLKKGACSCSSPASERLLASSSSSLLRMYFRMSMGRHWKGSRTCRRKASLCCAYRCASSRTTTERTYSLEHSVGVGSGRARWTLMALLSTSQEQVVMKLCSSVLLLRIATQKSRISACSTSSTSRSLWLGLSLGFSSSDSELASSLILSSLWKLPANWSGACCLLWRRSISRLNSSVLRAGESAGLARKSRSWRMLRSLSLCSASSRMISALKLSMSSWVSFRKGSNSALRSPSCLSTRLQKSDRLMLVERLKATSTLSDSSAWLARITSFAPVGSVGLAWFSKEMGERNLREDLSLLTESASLEPLSFRTTSLYRCTSFYSYWLRSWACLFCGRCFRKSCSESEPCWLWVTMESKCTTWLWVSADRWSLPESSVAFSWRLAQFWLRYSMSRSILWATCGSFLRLCSSDSISCHLFSCSRLNTSTFSAEADSSAPLASDREWNHSSPLGRSSKLDLMCAKGHSAFLPSWRLASSFRSRFSSKQDPRLSENSVFICGTRFFSFTFGSSCSSTAPTGQRKASALERELCIFFFMVFFSSLASCLLYLISLSATSKRLAWRTSLSGERSLSVLRRERDLDLSLERDLFSLGCGKRRLETDLLKGSLSWVERQVLGLETDLDLSRDLDLEWSKRMGEVVSRRPLPSLVCDFLWAWECRCDYLDLQGSEEGWAEAALGLLQWLFSSFLAFFFSGVPLALPGDPFFAFLGFLVWASAALALALSSGCRGFLVTSMRRLISQRTIYIINEAIKRGRRRAEAAGGSAGRLQ